MPDRIADPLHDPRVIAARARVTNVERVRERFADPTCEVAASTQTASMRIYGRIDSDGAPWGISAQDVAQALDALPDDTTRLDVHIHSRGGDAFDGLAILNLLQQAKPEVHTHVDGLAASAASAIAMAGKTVTMAPSATLMIHDASGIGVGQAGDMRVLADALDSVSESYAAAYAAKTGVDAAEWRAAMQPETWYRADEAVKAKLADTLVAPAPSEPKVTASLDLSIFAYAGRDNAPEPFMPTAMKPPAEPPVVPPIHPKEADAMSDELIKGLRERFEFDEGADTSAILASIDADIAANEKTIEALEAKATAVPEGSKVVPQAYLDSLKEGAEAGKTALARQRREDRDRALAQAQADGKIGHAEAEVKNWAATWDRDPEETAKWIAELPVRFPIGDAPGHAGTPSAIADTYTDEKAAQDADLFGIEKEAFLR